MAETVIRLLGRRFPLLCMSLVGAIVSVPVFCDSGFVILHSLKQSLARRLQISGMAMSVALATGLYATHTFVPPTPGPIAAAGNLGLEPHLGWVIGMGLLVSIVPVLTGCWWAGHFKTAAPEGANFPAENIEEKRAAYGKLPCAWAAFFPIVLPIVLICLGSVVNFPGKTADTDNLFANSLNFLGKPLVALFIGMLAAFFLVRGDARTGATEKISLAITEGIAAAAPILLITGAGGAFGAVLKATPLGDYLGSTLTGLGLGIFMPFVVAAALKTAQGSSTVALVATSALVAPLLPDLGLDSTMGRTLAVMAIGAGAMTVSHANDSFFWVVSQFSRMSVAQGYKMQTTATLIQGLSAMAIIWLLTLVLL